MHKAHFEKDFANKTMTMTRDFDAPKSRVWEAWTKSDLLDKWWGPAPWKTETKSFDFKEGGSWLYAMVGPDGTKSWCKNEYLRIDPENSFTATDMFCDENGVRNPEFPEGKWLVEFSEQNGVTTVKTAISYETEEGMKKMVDMGMEEGFSIGLNQLEELLAKV